MARPKKSVQEKMKDANPEFVTEVNGLAVEELNSRLASSAKDLDGIIESMGDDDSLAQAKDEASALAAPYRDAKKAVKLKMKYLIEIIKERS